MSAEEKDSFAEAKETTPPEATGELASGGGSSSALDDEAITFIAPEAKALSPIGRPAGMGSLDLSLAAAAADQAQDAKTPSAEDDVLRQATTPVTILFDLPDGSQIEGEFQMGQTIEVLKSYVSVDIGIPMQEQSLYLEDGTGPLMDPMSIMDYPQIDPRKGEVFIRVDGIMDDDGGAKK